MCVYIYVKVIGHRIMIDSENEKGNTFNWQGAAILQLYDETTSFPHN